MVANYFANFKKHQARLSTQIMRVLSIPIDNRPDIVVNLDRVIVNTYSVTRGASIRTGRILFTPLKLLSDLVSIISKVIIALFAGIVLIVLLVTLILLLAYGNTIFSIFKDSLLKSHQHLDRAILIDRHLRFERVVNSLRSMRKSKILFSSPILGNMNMTFLRNVEYVEENLKRLAYPHIGTFPDNIPVHPLDPSDPWQDDLDQYNKDEVFIVN